jgi:hypothetical protein
MANLRRKKPQQTESLFAENHESFFNSIGQTETMRDVRIASASPRILLQNSVGF